jgi:hypothetical protein
LPNQSRAENSAVGVIANGYLVLAESLSACVAFEKAGFIGADYRKWVIASSVVVSTSAWFCLHAAMVVSIDFREFSSEQEQLN